MTKNLTIVSSKTAQKVKFNSPDSQDRGYQMHVLTITLPADMKLALWKGEEIKVTF